MVPRRICCAIASSDPASAVRVDPVGKCFDVFCACGVHRHAAAQVQPRRHLERVVIVQLLNTKLVMVWLPTAAFKSVGVVIEEAVRDLGAS